MFVALLTFLGGQTSTWTWQWGEKKMGKMVVVLKAVVRSAHGFGSGKKGKNVCGFAYIPGIFTF